MFAPSDRSRTRMSTWIVLSSFALFWVSLTMVVFVNESQPAAMYISGAAFVPLVLGALLITRSSRKRRR